MFRLPLTVRIPLAVSVLFLVFAAALTSLALHGLSRQFDDQIARLGQVYLDGLAAAILPAARVGDREEMLRVFDRSLATHVGVVDRALAVVGPDDRLTAYAARYPDVEQVPVDLVRSVSGSAMSAQHDYVWTWRALDEAQPALGRLVANLHVGNFLQQRRALALQLSLIGLGIGVLGALLCFGLARRLQRPIILLTQTLRAAQGARPLAVGAHAYTADPEIRELLDAYNWMAQGVREREDLAERHARIEREAVLGRMAAALAHEIRNPLGGMRTAVQTLRQFGAREDVRQESLAFIDRGVEALQGVVDASLRTFRPGGALLCRTDIEDIQLMVRAQAGAGGIAVQIHCDGIDERSLPLPAGPVRQVLLNLVLNAVQASPRGSVIYVSARVRAGAVNLHVCDAGPRLPAQARAALAGQPHSDGDGMGLGIVRELVRAMAGHVTATSRGRGTRISVRLPLKAGSDHT